ncbi:MAG: 4-vinyl reductase [Anaerolineae bacterium]|nr:4-vinyl reductase [Anaerolineae bacterium]
MLEDKAKETEKKPEVAKQEEVKAGAPQKPEAQAGAPQKPEVKAGVPQKPEVKAGESQKAEAKPAAPKKAEAQEEEGKIYYYPNKWARVILTSAEEVMGAQGVAALLNLSGMKELIGNYPPDNMKKEFSFEQVGKLQAGIWEMYGNRGARVFATRAGEQSFKGGLSQFKSVAAAAQVAMKVGTLEAKVKLGLEFFCRFFNSVSDQVVEVSEDDKHWIWTITRCPVCWGRKTDEPCCHLAIGVLQAAFAWVTEGKKFRILETECKAKGDENCVIKIEKVPVE